MGAAAMVAVPAWASNWTASTLPETQALSLADDAMLTDLVDILIPKTDTPGAVELGVVKFVQAMIETQHSEEDQKMFYDQLGKFDAFSSEKYNRNFSQLTAAEKGLLLGWTSVHKDENWKSFYNLLKRYTVQGYTGSEWYMTEIADYEYAPGYGHGCVDVK